MEEDGTLIVGDMTDTRRGRLVWRTIMETRADSITVDLNDEYDHSKLECRVIERWEDILNEEFSQQY